MFAATRFAVGVLIVVMLKLLFMLIDLVCLCFVKLYYCWLLCVWRDVLIVLFYLIFI